ncbi:MAG: glutamine amidotransferase [Planctomycetota bacterium]
MTPGGPVLAVLTVGPIEFAQPAWLWLLVVLVPLTLLIGRKSLSGMATASRRVALGVRIVVLAMVVAALAEPHLRDEAEDVAVTVITDRSRSVPPPAQQRARTYARGLLDAHKAQTDRFGSIATAREAFIGSLPKTLTDDVEQTYSGRTDQTDLAEALRLGLAIRPPDAAYRLVLMTDGNETAGDLLAEARAARAQGVPIDVLPLRYSYRNEVIVERLLAPATARRDENANLRVTLNSEGPAEGTLSILANGRPIDLDPTSEGLGEMVSLRPGPNTFVVPIRVPAAEALQFEAVFEPAGGAGEQDTILENNRALATTFVASEGRVLVLTQEGGDAGAFVRALRDSGIAADVREAAQIPDTLAALSAFDAIVLMNQAAADFSFQAQDQIRQYVHDLGGGLVMIGGPNSFGAGGWQNTPLEDVLPVRLDPPQKRQLPRGALALIMHSIEMPQGVFYGQQTAKAAVDALTRKDLVGINEFTGFGGSTRWVLPMSEVGDRSPAYRAIDDLRFGDMPTFNPSLQMTYDALVEADAAVKHAIIISDGDPSYSNRILAQFQKAQITISTVGVFPHSPGDFNSLRNIAQQTGGRFYPVTQQAQLATLPQIFIREAQTVKRPLIWEGTPFVPTITPGLTEAMRGIRGVPPIMGYVVAGEREGLAIVSMRGKENDPIMAQWQHGLGRVLAYTSDALPRWNTMWLGWGEYQSFWEQHVRWTMRATGDANVRVTTETDGDRTRVIVEATDPGGRRLNFAQFAGRIATPDGSGAEISLQQTGPGRYEGSFDSEDAGSYVLSLGYDAPGQDGARLEGTVQAAVDRPFADEFRATQANEALLRRVAELTGGRVLPDDPAAEDANVWRRDGVEMPVALSSVWLPTAILAIGLFLVDVGVRRVRIDVMGFLRVLRRGARSGEKTAAQQIDALREARAKAQQRLARPDAGPSEKVRAAMREEDRRATAKARFEVDEADLKGAGPSVVESADGAARPARPAAEADATTNQDDEGMSRLLKAKRRTREEMDDQQ